MTAKWPQVAVGHKDAKKRGGGDYSQYVARALTEMPCGTTLSHSERGRAPATIEEEAERKLKIAARNHLNAHGCGQ